MGRKSIRKTAMTPAERQRRRRAKLKREESDDLKKKRAAKARDKRDREYRPVPPGMTYWYQARIQTENGERLIWQPKTRPLAACRTDLEDEDILALLRQIENEAIRRGLREPRPGEPIPPSHSGVRDFRGGVVDL